jgi:hypothetical protein
MLNQPNRRIMVHLTNTRSRCPQELPAHLQHAACTNKRGQGGTCRHYSDFELERGTRQAFFTQLSGNADHRLPGVPILLSSILLHRWLELRFCQVWRLDQFHLATALARRVVKKDPVLICRPDRMATLLPPLFKTQYPSDDPTTPAQQAFL